ncbi:unnamed protein product, partial [Ixodes persulcatus]
GAAHLVGRAAGRDSEGPGAGSLVPGRPPRGGTPAPPPSGRALPPGGLWYTPVRSGRPGSREALLRGA